MHAHHDRLLAQLKAREAAGNLRRLPQDVQGVDFYSNDYLGLARLSLPAAPRVIPTAPDVQRRNGATGSRLLSGNSTAAEDLERMLAGFFETPATLLYNNGYMANLGLLSALPGRQDTVLYDSLSHACIKEGIRLSPAKRFPFRHNDLDDLESRLSKAAEGPGLCWVVVESVYSMDGDEAPLVDLLAVAQKYGAALIVDEAHSTGVFGQGGRGLCHELGIADQVFARVHTFGKAMGSHGAVVAGSKALRDYLVNFSRAFIYTTALPPHAVQSIYASFDYLMQHPKCIGDLHGVIAAFRRKLKEKAAELPGTWVDSRSPIQAMIYPGNAAVKALAASLQNAGLIVKPILSPTVREGEERLRICLHAYNSSEDLDRLIESLSTFTA